MLVGGQVRPCLRNGVLPVMNSKFDLLLGRAARPPTKTQRSLLRRERGTTNETNLRDTRKVFENYCCENGARPYTIHHIILHIDNSCRYSYILLPATIEGEGLFETNHDKDADYDYEYIECDYW